MFIQDTSLSSYTYPSCWITQCSYSGIQGVMNCRKSLDIIHKIQSTLVISTSIILNNRLSPRVNLVLLLSRYRTSGKFAPKEQFLPFSTIFSIYISNLNSQITYLFVKFGCSICIFLNSANLICGSTNISKCFREFL